MTNKIKLIYLGIIALSVMSFVGYSVSTSYADECEEGQIMCNDQCISECTGGKTMDTSSCTCSCASTEDECLGTCYTQCPIGESRDSESCECEMDDCDNGAGNPPDCSECADGEEMCGGTCLTNCEDGYSRDAESCECELDDCMNGATNPPLCTVCPTGQVFDPAPPYHCTVYCDDPLASNYEEYAVCEYDVEYCCADENAINYDDECPDPNADPEKIEDNSGVCEYCTKDSTEFECEVYYCDSEEFPEATNGETRADCDANHPDNPCVSDPTECTWPQITYCPDTTTPADNAETQEDCDNSIPIEWPPCEPDQSVCTYPGKDYCADNTASNYQTEEECQGGIAEVECTPRYTGPVCEYNYCLIDFGLDITCPSGFKFKTPVDSPYVYSYALGAGQACLLTLTTEESLILSSYFEQLICGAGGTPVCTGDLCSSIDWCPSMVGTQTDPADCLDVCPDKPGLQTNENECNTNNLCINLGNIPLPSGYYMNAQNQCYPCKNGVCQPVNGVCGSASNTGASYISDITGTSACATGIKSSVTKNGNLFNWSCLGIEGGLDQGCQANLVCGSGLTYCENKGICSDKCYVGNDCANSNICVFKGNVDLNPKLNVTPIVDRSGTCVVNLDKTSEVFEAFDTTTHCTLSTQNGVIATFDPANLTADGDNITKYSVPNVKKDTTFTLKCHDGEITETTTYETSVGSCRLNIKTIETN